MVKKILAGLMVGNLLAIVVTACSIREASPVVIPTVHMAALGFIQDAITFHKRGDARSCGRSPSRHIKLKMAVG